MMGKKKNYSQPEETKFNVFEEKTENQHWILKVTCCGNSFRQ